MKKQTKHKKTPISKARPAKSLTKTRKKVTVTKAAKVSVVKTKAVKKPQKIAKKRVATKAAGAKIVKSATKPVQKKHSSKPAVAATVKTTAKSLKSKSSSAAAIPTFAKTNKPVAPLRERPLSPHLGIYSPQITSVLSILHRATGVALYIGAFVLAGLIIRLGYGEAGFAKAIEIFRLPVMTVFLFGWVFCLYYHLCNGIRHLLWDMGKGFELLSVTISGLIVLFVSLTLTFTTFFITHPEFLGQFAQ